MANVDNPSGLSPLGTISGAPYNGKTLRCVILAADTTNTFVGDAVKIDPAGSDVTGKYPAVSQATAGAQIFGVIDSIEFDPDDLMSTHAAGASTSDRFVNVAVDPDTTFAIQEDSVVSTLTAADAGLNANLIVGTGNTTTGRSAFEIDSSSAAVTATLDVQLIRLLNRADNAIGANGIWEVKINNHRFGSGTGTAGA